VPFYDRHGGFTVVQTVAHLLSCIECSTISIRRLRLRVVGTLFVSGWMDYAVWGLVGGAIVDGIEFWQIVRANRGSWPLEYRTFAFGVAELVRLSAGAGLAVAFGLSGQVTGPMGAMTIGLAAPLIVEKLSRQLPAFLVDETRDEPTRDSSQSSPITISQGERPGSSS
jgi:hypothetical protein